LDRPYKMAVNAYDVNPIITHLRHPRRRPSP
jgi:hypothetical protein